MFETINMVIVKFYFFINFFVHQVSNKIYTNTDAFKAYPLW